MTCANTQGTKPPGCLEIRAQDGVIGDEVVQGQKVEAGILCIALCLKPGWDEPGWSEGAARGLAGREPSFCRLP